MTFFIVVTHLLIIRSFLRFLRYASWLKLWSVAWASALQPRNLPVECRFTSRGMGTKEVSLEELLLRSRRDDKWEACAFESVSPLACNRPFYSCVLNYLAFECKRGWSWPCFDTVLSAFSFKCRLVSIRTTWFTQQKQCQNKVTSLVPASLPFRGQVTEQTTVKWSVLQPQMSLLYPIGLSAVNSKNVYVFSDVASKNLVWHIKLVVFLCRSCLRFLHEKEFVVWFPMTGLSVYGCCC